MDNAIAGCWSEVASRVFAMAWKISKKPFALTCSAISLTAFSETPRADAHTLIASAGFC